MQRMGGGVVYMGNIVPRDLGDIRHGRHADQFQLTFDVAVGQVAYRGATLGPDGVAAIWVVRAQAALDVHGI
eukprot:55546-Eustigmatos_ZCMA.PRE.1